MFRIDGKIALVTGGSKGIGFALAVGLANAGATITFNATSQNSINKALEKYKQLGICAYGYVADVTKEDEVNKMIEDIKLKLGAIDILVNNAGILIRGPMHKQSMEDVRRVIDVDLVAPYLLSKAILPDMMKKKSGKIINICSMLSEVGRETSSSYAAAKGGLKMLTKNIASEYGMYNIQCNGIGPGYINTPMTDALREPQPDGTMHPFDKFIRGRTPAGRWGTSDDLVGPMIFLASSASDFVNGHILYVDGGILAYLGRPEEE